MLQIKLMDEMDLFVSHRPQREVLEEHVELTFVDADDEDYVVRLDSAAASTLAMSLLIYLRRNDEVTPELVMKASQELMG